MKEDFKKLLEKLKDMGAIEDYKELNKNTIRLSVNYDYYYISFDKDGKLEEDSDKAEAKADILEKEQELQELKEQYKKEYGEEDL